MHIALYLIACILIVALFLYSKLLPYKSQLAGTYHQIFVFFDAIFSPILGLLNKIVAPLQVGYGLAVDTAQLILLILLLIILML
jgi:hypothetical protein